MEITFDSQLSFGLHKNLLSFQQALAALQAAWDQAAVDGAKMGSKCPDITRFSRIIKESAENMLKICQIKKQLATRTGGAITRSKRRFAFDKNDDDDYICCKKYAKQEI